MNRRKFLKLLGGAPLLAAGAAVAEPVLSDLNGKNVTIVSDGFLVPRSASHSQQQADEVSHEIYGRSPVATGLEALRAQNQMTDEFVRQFEKDVIHLFRQKGAMNG